MSARMILSPRAFTHFTRRNEHALNVCKSALKIPAFGTSQNIATLSPTTKTHSPHYAGSPERVMLLCVSIYRRKRCLLRPPKHRFAGPAG